jgi:PPM family protein phosphatase
MDQDRVRTRRAMKTDIGRQRSRNEDRAAVEDLGYGFLFAVCDGVGGCPSGHVASNLASLTITEEMMAKPSPRTERELVERLVKALQAANTAIRQESATFLAYRSMCTTATVAVVFNDCLLIGHVGDSRAYLLRGHLLNQLTNDHSEASAEGLVLIRALGLHETVDVDILRVPLKRDDRLLLCTDGLTNMLPDSAILHLLLGANDPPGACEGLVNFANDVGGYDNITVVLAWFDGDGLAEPTPEDKYGRLPGLLALDRPFQTGL